MYKKLLNILSIGFISALLSFSAQSKIIVAIDAGHGGKDPGAIGKTLGLKEKEVTLSIARELKALLDKDPNFKAVMTRNGDYFIQLPQRTEIARKNKANFLISIHADSSPSSKDLRGASVWVLSNRRANDELGKWLEDHEKQSELLGGAGSVLSNNNERYLNQTVLDLQFSHSQRTGYELGKTVLGKMSNITQLVKSSPQHASLSVLRSPDIPSILVETGFLSNAVEEKKLSTKAYRRQVARAIYNGLVAYRSKNPGYALPKTATSTTKENKTANNKKESKNNKEKATQAEKNKKAAVVESKGSATKSTTKKVNSNATYHVVQKDETLYSIAKMYNTTPEKLSKLNNIKNNKIVVGKKLKLK
ncbi:N-acetylmuramoyl-L-alanine amidase [Glaesserella sp.]|uniref:N-acetylmuramoyl-L-alanine amidase n=1 Tax=Glaesserella sp. TaxID=2094731 RepID=UPI0035A01C14